MIENRESWSAIFYQRFAIFEHTAQRKRESFSQSEAHEVSLFLFSGHPLFSNVLRVYLK